MGASNIDWTIANNQAIGSINNWSIHERESCSDHNILKYELGNEKDSHSDTGPIMKRTRYIVKQRHEQVSGEIYKYNGTTSHRNKYQGSWSCVAR